MAETPPESLRSVLHALSQPNPVLFAGAGVGQRAGLPGWTAYIEHLASIAERYEPPTAALIRARTSAGLFTDAARYYKQCAVIPKGERLQHLASPFARDKYTVDTLRALISLPFRAIVTTNYDHSLHDAYADVHQIAPMNAELGDPSLRHAMYSWKEFFIARVHGRAEVPESMVLDSDDYARTERDADYTEFLTYILTRNNCLFVGYSFVDPAIGRILDLIEQRVAPAYGSLHTALLPSSASADTLRARLAKYNIRVVAYAEDSTHESAWRLIREALTKYRERPTPAVFTHPAPLEQGRKLLAACYTRQQMGTASQSLRRIVTDGIVLGVLADKAPATISELTDKVRALIPLTASEADVVVTTGLSGLSDRGIASVSEDTVSLLRLPENRLSDEIGVLLAGVVSRLVVREGHNASDAEQKIIRIVLEDLVLLRGWDLGAAFARASSRAGFEVGPVLRATLAHRGPSIPEPGRERIARAVIDLLQRPDVHEAQVLVNLGRLAFGVEVAIDRGRSTLVHGVTLPEVVYLDASVIMPAIVEGHPHASAYAAALTRLRDAASRAAVDFRLRVLDVFLNEVLSHRFGAIKLVKDELLEERENLERFIMYMGTTNVNVYIASYAAHILSGRNMRFSEYLAKAAPYQTEKELADFLNRRGIETSKSEPRGIDEQAAFGRILGELTLAYQKDAVGLYDRKPAILVNHEAVQLARLDTELRRGSRCVFVTADARLRRITVGEVLGHPGAALLSQVGLIQLIDLLVGIEADPQSLARVLWAIEASDEESHLRSYFVDQALKHYDAAMAKAMTGILDGFIAQARRAASESHIKLKPEETGDQPGATLKFLGNYENLFYQRMADEIRRTERR